MTPSDPSQSKSEIPADILEAAENALDDMLCECTESCGGSEGLRKDAISKIGAAILAERERCAAIALNYDDGRPYDKHDHTAYEIAQLIRGEA